jgi:hypothetical protein
LRPAKSHTVSALARAVNQQENGKVNKSREPDTPLGVQQLEDARTSHPCERRAGNCKATCSSRRG